ncbi:TonB-dependent receptor [Namhaeicola litoreus]|uniref:TonB-dependent receptor n=1 Tax=Namhaeicola litoreus TaxID=1052145 RepID=A0ABW3Y3C0_9FLAO
MAWLIPNKFLNHLIINILFVYAFAGYSQYAGKIIHGEKLIPLSQTEIISNKKNEVYQTNLQGEFDLSDEGKYVLVKEGFKTDTIIISKSFEVFYLYPLSEDLDEIVLTSNNFTSSLKTYAGGATVVEKNEINIQNNINIAPILNSVSGVFMQNGTLSTNRITIRGIGSRTLFGTSKIRAYYQDIPLTNGSGESNMDDLELDAIARIEITKGPSSSTYGAGLGGTIHWIPKKGNISYFNPEIRFTMGSFGLRKYSIQSDLPLKNGAMNLLYSNTESEGYRENNQLDKQIINLTSNHFLSEKHTLNFISNYISLKSYIPSSLDFDTYKNNPSDAAFTWGASKGNEDYQKGLFGLSWNYSVNDKSSLKTSIYSTFLASDEDRPFNILEENTLSVGLRSKFLSEHILFNKNLNWTVGFEVFRDKKDYQTFENLYRDFPPESGSVKGEIISDLVENRQFFNLFFDSKLLLTEKIQFHLGMNWNYTTYTLDDLFNKEINNASGNYNFGHIFSPKIGFSYEYLDNHVGYATIAHGFSPPTLEETLLPDGQINQNIKPETGWNFEMGARGTFKNLKLDYSLSLYQMKVKDQLVARRTGDDEFVGINAGETDFVGIEIDLNYPLLTSDFWQIKHRNSFSYNLYTFQDFEDLDNDFSGNKVTGVPPVVFNSLLFFQTKPGFYSTLQYQFIDEIPVNDANSIFADSYQLLHVKLGYQNAFFQNFRFDAFFGMNNLFDEKYASMLQINATAFGNNSPRYYYPGEPLNYYFGVNLSYFF